MVRRSPPPQTQILGFSWTGRGSQNAFSTWKCFPWNVVCPIAQHRPDDLDPLLQHVQPDGDRRKGYPECAVLPFQPAGAQPKLQPASAELVYGSGGLGQNGGVAVSDTESQDPHAHTGRLQGQGGQGGDRLEARPAPVHRGVVVEMVPDRHLMEPGGVGDMPEPAQLVIRAVLRPAVNPEIHAFDSAGYGSVGTAARRWVATPIVFSPSKASME